MTVLAGAWVRAREGAGAREEEGEREGEREGEGRGAQHMRHTHTRDAYAYDDATRTRTRRVRVHSAVCSRPGIYGLTAIENDDDFFGSWVSGQPAARHLTAHPAQQHVELRDRIEHLKHWLYVDRRRAENISWHCREQGRFPGTVR